MKQPNLTPRRALLLCAALLPCSVFAATPEEPASEDTKAKDEKTDTTTLAPMVVEANATRPNASRSATKIDVPVKDLPLSLQSVARETIHEQAAREMKDVLRNVTSVSFNQGEGRRDQFYIRGFDAVRDTLLDGMRDDSLYFRDLATIEQVDVIKGPAAALYGRGSAGGVINRVTKKPVADPLAEFGVSVGSDEFYRAEADLGGSLGHGFTSRFVGAYETSESYRDIVEWDKLLLAPSVAWRLDDRTTFLFQAEYLDQSRTPDRGIPSLNGRPAPVSAGNFYGEKYDYADTEAANVRFAIDHEVNDDLNVRNNFMYSGLTLDAVNTRTLGLTADQQSVRRQVVYFPQEQTNFLNQTEAVYRFNTGFAKHTLLGGLEVGHQTADMQTKFAAASNVSLSSPQHAMSMPNFSAISPSFDQDFTNDTVGLYVQDQVSLGEQWKALAGLRYDSYQQQRDNNLTGVRHERDDSLWSPRVGVVYQPVKEISIYGNVSLSNQPIGEMFYVSSPFESIKPTETFQREIGVKGEWLDGRLVSTVAYFDILQSNVVTNDPSDPTGVLKVQTGEQRSRGVDVDFSYSLADRWKLFAGYTWLDASIEESNNFPAGNRPGNIPEHNARVWSTVELGHGFIAGAGASYVGDRFTTEDNTVVMPSYVRIDAMFGYQRKDWDVTLNVHNLTDKDYYEAANNNNQIQPGAPLGFTVSSRLRF
jgi:catecholate siderophore receptor